MHFSSIISTAALLAVGVSSAAAAKPKTVTKTVTVTAAPTEPTTCFKTSRGYNQYICKSGGALCLGSGNILGSPSVATQFDLISGGIEIIYDGSWGFVEDSVNGGNLTFPETTRGGYQVPCYFGTAKHQAFNCFNQAGTEFLWYLNPDSSVGLALETIPSGTTALNMIWVGTGSS